MLIAIQRAGCIIVLASGERRLAAISFMDLVSYTQLSQRNEELALGQLEEYRRVLRPLFARHHGNEVKTIGDGFLVEFPSALEALRCAFDIQHSLHDLNSSRPPEKQILVRIGIHIGDVIHTGNDIYGDAVNIASRIEPLAEPGGICISQPTHTQVRNKFEFPIQSMGVRALKNVDLPMEVFKILLPWDKLQPSEEQQRPLAPKTRIAILPFSNISPDPSDEYFADGMTEELINTISHNHQLKVIARTTAGRYKGSPKSVSEIAKEIGVGSVLEGSVRKAGNKIRVTAQLIDASTEDHMWSDNYDRQLDDIFSIQSEIAKSVSEALTARLLPQEQRNIEKKTTSSSAAYVRYLRGRLALRDRTESGLREAKKMFEAAIAEDPDYAEAHAGLADTYFLLGNYDHMPKREANEEVKRNVDRALFLDNDLAEAHNTLAQYLSQDYRFAEAQREFKVAIDLSPNYSLAHHWYAICLMEMGIWDQSLKEMRTAAELDPLSAALAANVAYSYVLLGAYSEAEKWLQKLEELDTHHQFLDFMMTLISEVKGDLEGAVAHTEEALRTRPSNNAYAAWLGFYYAKSGKREKATEILEKLKGLPDGTGNSFNIAVILVGLDDDRDEMFRQLDLAFDERSIPFRTLRQIKFEPSIREDKRYIALFQRAHISP